MAFKVTIQPANVSFEVQRDEAILPAAIRSGIGLPYGCRDGACGSCKSRLLEGRVIHGAHQVKALSPEEEAQGLILTCCSTPQTDCVVQARSSVVSGEYAPQKFPVRVASLSRAAPDVMVMKLQLPANGAFKYRAGQYLEFILRDGSRRSYSMANAPQHLGEPPMVELHLRHMPGGKFTDHVFGAMKDKEILRAEGPLGSFYLREDSQKPLVLLASGTGVAPIKALVEHMRASNITRPAALYWGCRSKADLYLHAWAEQAARELPWLRYVPVLSDATPEDAWAGRTGFVHRIVMADLPDLSGHEVYACGAPIMVESAHKDFVAQCGLPDEAFYADSFTSEADKHAA
jgi:CDP-4-dehydro-6-deoxyglucose reductase, E3